MITYKFDILQVLKDAGHTTYQLRKNKLLGEATIQQLREGRPISWVNIDTICRLLGCQPGDILQYTPDAPDELVIIRSQPLVFDGGPGKLITD